MKRIQRLGVLIAVLFAAVQAGAQSARPQAYFPEKDKWERRKDLQPGLYGPDYGYLWWLNTQDKQWPDAPRTSFSAVGAGNNTIWIDPEHDLVVVWRWHRGTANEFYKRIVQAVRQ